MKASSSKNKKMARWLVWLVLAVVLLAGYVVDLSGGYGKIPAWQQLYGFLGLEADRPGAKFSADGTSVAVLDVGQGDAILLCRNGEYCLIDTGPSADKRALEQGLRDCGVKKLKLLILTHPHADHIGGAMTVLENFKVDQVLLPTISLLGEGSVWQRRIYDYVTEHKIPAEIARTGQEFALDDGKITVLLAGYQTTGNGDAVNNTSTCIQFTDGTYTVLNTGDAEQEVEEALVEEYGGALRSDLLIAGHHGSSTSNSAVFLEAVQPKTIAISCGANNDYGHPHAGALRRMAAAGATILRTDESGTLLFTPEEKAADGQIRPKAA